VLDADGVPVLDAKGRPQTRQLGAECPDLVAGKRGHGVWYYYLNLDAFNDGVRTRPRIGGHLTKDDAEKAAQIAWDEASAGVMKSDETCDVFLSRWLDIRTDLKRSTMAGYRDYVNRVFGPALAGHRVSSVRTKHVQDVFTGIKAANELHAENRRLAHLARLELDAARTAWREAPMPRPPELRARVNVAREALAAARRQPRHITGPGTQLRMKNMLTKAFEYARTKDKVRVDNPVEGVHIPIYRPPKPLLWSRAREAAWRETGARPGPVMVWRPDQAGAFLDAVAESRLFPLWHLMMFRALRRGEVCGLPRAEIDLDAGTVSVAAQLVAASYEVWEDTPKSDASTRVFSLDPEGVDLLRGWCARQDEDRRAWEEIGGTWPENGLLFRWEDGTAVHPEYVSQLFTRTVARLGLPPVRLHDLRHLAASLAHAAGVSMKGIQVLLGHESYELTATTYTTLFEEFDMAAAKAMVAIVPRAGIVVPVPRTPADEAVPTAELTRATSDALSSPRSHLERSGSKRLTHFVSRTGKKTRSSVVPPAGFEPATPALGERCSIP